MVTQNDSDCRRRIASMRAQAGEARAAAGRMKHAEPRQMMIRMARTFETIACLLEDMMERRPLKDAG
jgi:hypothetical protein